MKKKLLIFFIVIGVLQLISYSFDFLRFYNYPTSANEPNLKTGSRFIMSSLVKPERLDFICYEVISDTSNYFVAMRLVGIPNDVVSLKDGELYVNEKNFDRSLNLRKKYKVPMVYYDSILKPLIAYDQIIFDRNNIDSISVLLDDDFIDKSDFYFKREVISFDYSNPEIEDIYNASWNIDNFGPFKIPEGEYFVIGDNRYNSIDSRYVGTINSKNIKGTIIFKF